MIYTQKDIDMYKKMICNNKLLQRAILVLIVTLTVIAVLNVSTKAVLAEEAQPGCYTIQDGRPARLDECPTTGAVYDDGSGANLAGPADDKCYVYSENLYDGDASFGDPYVQVNCSTLIVCPENQELRYNPDAAGPPTCVDVAVPTSGTYVEPSGQVSVACNEGEYATQADFTCINREQIYNQTDCGDIQNAASSCGIIIMANDVIKILSALVAVVATIMLTFAGVRYASAGSDPNAVAAAKDMIKNVIIAIIVFIFLFGLINWVVPGGI